MFIISFYVLSSVRLNLLGRPSYKVKRYIYDFTFIIREVCRFKEEERVSSSKE
jgi:hypothetical protein